MEERATHIAKLSFQKAWKHKEGLVNEYSIEGFKRIQGESIEEGVHKNQKFKKGYVICYSIHKNTSCSIEMQFLKLAYNHLFISCKLFNFFDDP